jgi:hypothetical protein
MFIRLTSILVGLVSLLAPIWLASFVSGVLSPERPISFSYLSIYISVGFALSVGYFCVAIFHRKLAATPLALRLLVSVLLALPLAFAFYLALGSHLGLVTIVCLAISFYTAWLIYTCLWSGSNPSFKRDWLKPAP